ncbi:MAG: hypothetical protein DRH20_10085 [Deltaproteobacteria bacterium]|nr:MAG: hypothetical protein DRH20_10085 [Deltaproteobacteria bacterium]
MDFHALLKANLSALQEVDADLWGRPCRLHNGARPGIFVSPSPLGRGTEGLLLAGSSLRFSKEE